jgi:hypothetical protein
MGEVDGKPSLRQRYKAFRKRLLSYTPFIRRSRHERALARLEKQLRHERTSNEGMGALFFSPPPLAPQARCEMRVPIRATPCDELCLFVTHAHAARLKAHVADHIDALLESGIRVVLVANTDQDFSRLEVPADWAKRLDGCLIRENVGYDFAAWAHAYSLIDPALVRQRLYLINDSIVGPLDSRAYAALLQRIRDSRADAVGLTSNPDPHPHLQSYYLVFNQRVLRSEFFDSFMRRIVNMPLKQNVIDCYEIWLTPFLAQRGFATAAIFPNFSTLPPPKRNDTVLAWRQLLEAGFPFIKSMVLRDPVDGDEARRRLPARYLS